LRNICAIATQYIESVYVDYCINNGRNDLTTIPNLWAPPAVIPWYVIINILHNPTYVDNTKNIIEKIIIEYEIGIKEIIQSFTGVNIYYASGINMLSFILSFMNVANTPKSDRTLFLSDIPRRDTSIFINIGKRLSNQVPRPVLVPAVPAVGGAPAVPAVLGASYLEGLQLMILHFLHFGFRTPILVPPIQEAASLFRNLVTTGWGAVVPGDYASFYKCNDTLMLDLQKIMNKLRFKQVPENAGGNFFIGGARKPRRNRTRKFHVKRRHTIKRRRS
jgi:hypothetical protein